MNYLKLPYLQCARPQIPFGRITGLSVVATLGSAILATMDNSRIGKPSLIGKVRVSSPGESHPEALAAL
jgi:hypothetical protein